MPSASPDPHAIALVGAGLMGSGLARVFGRVGWPVAAWDRDGAALARLSEDAPGTRIGASMADTVAGAALVIEAVSERLPVKQAVFAELAALTGPGTILATNSSVIPVGDITARLDDTDAARVVGTHFWNPPDLVPLVEVITGPRTAPATVARAMMLLAAAGKEPVEVRADVVPGNRLQHALWREAMALVDEGVCAPAEIDLIVKRSFGARLAVLGPLENADLVGLELSAQIHEVVLPTLSRATAPAAGLRERIGQGRLGIAVGRGYYEDWSTARIASVRRRLADHLRRAFAGE